MRVRAVALTNWLPLLPFLQSTLFSYSGTFLPNPNTRLLLSLLFSIPGILDSARHVLGTTHIQPSLVTGSSCSSRLSLHSFNCLCQYNNFSSLLTRSLRQTVRFICRVIISKFKRWVDGNGYIYQRIPLEEVCYCCKTFALLHSNPPMS